MVNIVVLGHGAYARGTKENLEMVSGISSNMYFIDLTKEDNLDDFEEKVKRLLRGFGNNKVLFACDIMGASPFRIAAMITAQNQEKYCTVAGLNAMAYMELAMSNEEDVHALAEKSVNTTKESVIKFLL